MAESTDKPPATSLATVLLMKQKMAAANPNKAPTSNAPALPAAGAHSNERVNYRQELPVSNAPTTTLPPEDKSDPTKISRKTKQLEVGQLDKRMEEIQRKQEEKTNQALDSWKGFDSINYGFSPGSVPPQQQQPPPAPAPAPVASSPVKHVSPVPPPKEPPEEKRMVESPKEKPSPKREKSPIKEEPPARKETPTKQKSPTRPATPVKQKSPTQEGTPIRQKSPVKEEPRAEKEEPPTKRESPAKEEPRVEKDEPPAKEESPIERSPRQHSPPIPPPRRSRMNSTPPSVRENTPEIEHKPRESSETPISTPLPTPSPISTPVPTPTQRWKSPTSNDTMPFTPIDTRPRVFETNRLPMIPKPASRSNARSLPVFPNAKQYGFKPGRNAHKSIQRSMDRYRFYVW